MGRFVIVGYRAYAGRQAELEALIQRHHPFLRELGLVSDRPPYLMQSVDGCLVEVFEWASVQAIEAAHQHPAVLDLWQAFGEVCEFVPLARLGEAQLTFAEFDALAPPPGT